MTILFLCVLVVACNKKAATPATPTVTSTPVPSLTSLETSLVGDWFLDKYEIYIDGVLMSTTLHNDSLNCHLDLQNTGRTASHPWMNCIHGIYCSSTVASWKENTGRLDVSGSLYTISTISSNGLVIYYGSLSSGQCEKFYFHK